MGYRGAGGSSSLIRTGWVGRGTGWEIRRARVVDNSGSHARCESWGVSWGVSWEKIQGPDGGVRP